MMKNGFNIDGNPKDRMQGEDHVNDGEDLSSVCFLTFEVQPNYFGCGLVDYEMTQVISMDKNTDNNACIFSDSLRRPNLLDL
jgi:hypothetical protein